MGPDLSSDGLSRIAAEFAARHGRAPRLLMVVTEDWYFVSHRLQLAEAVMRAGFDVSVATRVDRHGRMIRQTGVKLLPVAFDRAAMGPASNFATLLDLISIYRKNHPDIVHHVAIKPVVYGSLAATVTRVPCVVNALAGLGYVFRSEGAKASFLRALISPLFKLALATRDARVVVQNEDDRKFLVSNGFVRNERVTTIRGSGIDVSRYPRCNPALDPPLVILPARLLRDKGIGEFVDAALCLREQGVEARFALVGKSDPANPASISEAELSAWELEGVVELWGWREDMPLVFSQAQIVCLPSYHEGLPRVLLEAAASGCAIIASDIPGCRQIVRDGETGWLVPVGDVSALAETIRRAIESPELRVRFGAAAHTLVACELSLERVVSETIRLYGDLLTDQ